MALDLQRSKRHKNTLKRQHLCPEFTTWLLKIIQKQFSTGCKRERRPSRLSWSVTSLVSLPLVRELQGVLPYVWWHGEKVVPTWNCSQPSLRITSSDQFVISGMRQVPLYSREGLQKNLSTHKNHLQRKIALHVRGKIRIFTLGEKFL